MPERFYARLARFAVYAVVHAVAGAVLLVLPDLPAYVYGVWLGLGLPLLLSIGPYQAHVTGNAAIDEAARRRWRVALYWLLEVRPMHDQRP